MQKIKSWSKSVFFKVLIFITLLLGISFLLSVVRTGESSLSLDYKPTSTGTKPVFGADEKIEAVLNVASPKAGMHTGVMSGLAETVNSSLTEPAANVKAEVQDLGGQPVGVENLKVEWKGTKINGDQSWKVSFEKPQDFKPGSYRTKIKYTSEQGENKFINQDFLWGVLALNMHKNIYEPGENVHFDMAVLDDKGAMVCDAKLRLEIKGPQSTVLSTQDQTIVINEACRKKAKVDHPDYEAVWQIPRDWLKRVNGRYDVILTAETANGTWQISDEFEVGKPKLASIERSSATRIFPTADYDVHIDVKALKDMKGEFSESVPSSFEIIQTKLHKKEGDKWVEVRSPASTDVKGRLTSINWQVSLEKNSKYRFSYVYDAPDESPQFYLLGPATLSHNDELIFSEPRKWQVAVDDVLPTLRPDGDALDSASVLNEAGSNCSAVNCFTSIDDDPDSHNGDVDYNYSSVTGGSATQQYDIANTPANFVSMDSLNIKVAFRDINTAAGNGPDVHTVYARIFQADGTTPLTNEVIVHAHDGPDGSYVTTSAIGMILTGANTKTAWDGARLALRWEDIKDKGGDGLAIRVTAAELNGAYTALVPQTTIATGTDPAAATVAPGSGIRQVGTFTFQTNIATDSVTGLTVFLAGANNPFDGLADVQIRSNNCSGTLHFNTISNPSSGTLNFTGGTAITANTTLQTFAICVTPKSHALMPAVPGADYQTAPRVTGWTGANSKVGSDTNPNVLSIDNLSPDNATLATGTVGNEQNTINWTTSGSTDIDESIVLRWTAAAPGSDVPVEGTDYTSGNTIGAATVVCIRTSESPSNAVSCIDSPVTNGTQYSYKIFQQDTRGNYDSGLNISNNPLVPTTPTYDQSAYRWFVNNDSADVGAPLTNENSATIAPTQGTPFRLRTTLHVNTVQMKLSQENFKLQYAPKQGAACDINMSSTDETYSDVSPNSGTIRYHDNLLTADGVALTANANDPTHDSDPSVNQNYKESNNFTNGISAVNAGQDGLWDFALVDNSAPQATAYCFRIVKSDGTSLANYGVVPELTTYTSTALTSIGSGTDPAAATVAPGSTIRDAGSFTFHTNTGTDTVTQVNVSLNDVGTPFNGIAEVRITSADGSVTYWGPVTNPSSNTLTFCTSGCDGSGGVGNILVSSILSSFKIRITPKTHNNMPSPVGANYEIKAFVGSYVSANSQAGSDNNPNTLTIDNLSPGAATSLSAAAGNQRVTLNWTTTNGEVSDSVVLRWPASAPGNETPIEGVSYSVGNTISSATVACVYTSQSSATALNGIVDGAGGSGGCNTAALTNNQAYSYKVFQKDINGNYDNGTSFPNNPYTPAIPPIIVSGNVYKDDSSIPLEVCDGTTGLISLRVGSNQYGPVACNNSTGAYSFNNVVQPVGDEPMVVWIDGSVAAGLGSSVTVYDGTGDVSGFMLRKDSLIFSHDSGAGPVTNADAGICDSSCDPNIVYSTPGGTGGGQLTSIDGVELIIASGNNYTPGGNVTTSPSSSAVSKDGDVDVQSSATLSMGTNTLSVGGDLLLSGTYTISANQETLFTATTVGHSISTSVNNLADATFNGIGGGWSFASIDTITETLAVNAGVLSGTNDLTVNHDVTGGGTISLTGGTFTQRVDAARTFGATSGSANWTFNNLIFSNSSATARTITTNGGGTGNITVLTNLTIGATADTANTTINNETNDKALDVNGSFTITTRGIFSASSSAVFTIAKNLSNSGTFTSNTGNITFDTASQSEITGNGTVFYGLSATNADKNLLFGTAHTFTVNGALNITSAYINSTVNSPPYKGDDQWIINHQGTESVTVSSSVLNSGCAGGSTQVSVSSGTDGGNNGSCWVFFTNAIPNSPASLVQARTDDTVITAGQWNNSTNVKFSGSVSDPNGDTVQLCVEVKDTGTAFDGTEACGALVASGGTASVTINVGSINGEDTYHWRARAKDNIGATSAWVDFNTSDINTTDVGIDYTPPAVGPVYDTDGVSHTTDVLFNNGSLSTLSGGWSGFSDSVSGITGFEYSIGTSQGAADVVPWTSNGLVTNKTHTGLSLNTSQLYYFNVRATDGAGNVSNVASSDGQSVLPTIDFSVSPTNLAFNQNLNSTTNNDTESTNVTTSTNAYGGYVVRAWANNLLLNSTGNDSIPWHTGTWASPASPGVGYGYTSSDNSVQGSNRFSSGTLYSQFSTSAPGDVVADHTNTVSGSPITDEQFTITHRIEVDAVTQSAGVYNTEVIYLVTAEY